MRKLALALALLAAFPLVAQNVDIEALSGLQFNFGNPGARSLGMAGAFLGLADDASAAEANPAGLSILRKPEFSIEARNYLEQQIFTTSGTFPQVERTPFTHYSDRVVVSFASAVFPIRNKFTVGAYFHEPLNNEGGGVVAPRYDDFTGDLISTVPNFYMPTERRGTNVVPVGEPFSKADCDARRRALNDPFACLEYRLDPFVSALQVRLRTFGVAGAWQVHPKFSIGATARHQRFQEAAFTFRFTPQLDPKQVLVQATASPDGEGIDLGEEADTTFALGFKWSPSDKFSVGGVYKQGPEFETTLLYADSGTGFDFINAAQTSFHAPDIAGIGISYRPIPVLTINVDANHVKYSNLVDNFVSVYPAVAVVDEPFKADDVIEIRAGAEYFFATKIPFALRAGYFRDPKHNVTWNGPLNHPDYVAAAMLYPEGEDQNHFSIGAGIAWPRFQIDAAYQSSDHYKVGSLSFVTRF
ncbi:MAG TPA: outer membrane protein transport protein [Thermoanaerobaculia bacterium]|nr:outer membrane protein transport protein [Thermoanaerobaculia bacterium]